MGYSTQFERLLSRRYFQRREKQLTLKFWLMSHYLQHLCKKWDCINYSSGFPALPSFISLLFTFILQSACVCLVILSKLGLLLLDKTPWPKQLREQRVCFTGTLYYWRKSGKQIKLGKNLEAGTDAAWSYGDILSVEVSSSLMRQLV